MAVEVHGQDHPTLNCVDKKPHLFPTQVFLLKVINIEKLNQKILLW